MKHLACLYVWLVLLAPTGCRTVEPVVKVGLVGPFEGRQRPIGYDAIYSARLAVREANAAGGIGGYRIALVALDDGGDPQLAAQTAAALVRDPAVVVVVGHWLPETTQAAAPIYAAAGLPIVDTSQDPFSASDPNLLPEGFRVNYAAVTPFDEVAGPYAGPAYDAFQLIWAAIADATAAGSTLDREELSLVLPDIYVEGLTGEVYQP